MSSTEPNWTDPNRMNAGQSMLSVQIGTVVAPEELWRLSQQIDYVTNSVESAQRTLGSAASRWPILVGLMQDIAHARRRTQSLADGVRVAIDRYDRHESELARFAGFSTDHVFELLAPLIGPLNGALAALNSLVTPASGPQHLNANDVDVSVTGTANVRPPASLDEALNRIPSGHERIRIERYPDPDRPDGSRWMVYIAGTTSPAIVAGEQPFDMRSNLQLVSDEHEQHASSLRAVQAALVEAGHQADDSMVVIGHSQGGLVANSLASNQNYRIEQVVTIGTPLGSGFSDVPTLAFTHTNDVVPSLAGVTAAASNLVVIRTAAIAAGGLVAAHEVQAYRASVQRVQHSPVDAVRQSSDRVTRFSNRSGVASFWDSRRRSQGMNDGVD